MILQINSKRSQVKLNSKHIIIEILEIIEFTGNKDRFAKDFIRIVYLKAFVRLSKALPEDLKERMGTRTILKIQDPDTLISLINKYFDPYRIVDELHATAESTMSDFLAEIENLLTHEQKNKLVRYFSSHTPRL